MYFPPHSKKSALGAMSLKQITVLRQAPRSRFLFIISGSYESFTSVRLVKMRYNKILEKKGY
jgi:hypothetical protein